MRSDTRQSPQTAPKPQPHRARRQGNDVPAELRRRFADFRRAHAARTRVPEDLRRAALRALDQGVSIVALRRAIGITAQQVASWRLRKPAPTVILNGKPAAARGAPRIFEVADGPIVRGRAAASHDAGDVLELRLGAWSIVIRTPAA